MKIKANEKVAFAAIDVIVESWLANPRGFPYDHKKAVVPQRLVPEELRKNKFQLACFCFYVCFYMKGRIQSDQAFKLLLQMWRECPSMFDPALARFYSVEEIEATLQKYVNRDIVQTAKAWKSGSHRLMETWGGDPRNIVKGLRSWKEALRRIKNKRTKTARAQALRANGTGEGFEGFQDKMVSMLLYFFDWFGLLEHRFLYPAPADFHNLRFAFAVGALELVPTPEWTRYSTKLAQAWGRVLMKYLRSRNYDPLDVADALWLFSLLACGRSPLTTMIIPKEEDPLARHLFKNGNMRDGLQLIRPDFMSRNTAGFANRLQDTCLRCPFLAQCKYTIPAPPYYQNIIGPKGERWGGRIYFIPRPPIEQKFALPPKELDEEPHPSLWDEELPEQLAPSPPVSLKD